MRSAQGSRPAQDGPAERAGPLEAERPKLHAGGVMIESASLHRTNSRSQGFGRLRAIVTTAGLLLATALALGVRPAGPAQAGSAGSQTTGVTVTYPTGWNLVALPPGTDLSQISGPLYTYVSSSQSYESVQPDQAMPPWTGFWAYFAVPTTVVLGAGSTAPTSAGIIPGQWVMLGDPSGTTPAVIKGDAIAYTYDPLDGYQQVTRGFLLPGKGVWVTLEAGSHTAPAIDPSLMVPLNPASLDLTTPCGAALGGQGYLGEGSGEAIGDVDGQPVTVCVASGPAGTLPATNGIDCLLVGDQLTTLDGGTACGAMERVVQQDANVFLVVGHVSAAEQSVGVLTWDGSGFQSNPADDYILCRGVAQPIASADQCLH
jgi:hypothetical protein